MGADYYAVMGGSRICNSDRADQSGADDANVIDWTKTSDIILAVSVHSGGKDPIANTSKLRWRDVTDEGSFADVGATGEVHYNADTVLINGTNLVVGNRRCSTQGYAWQNGEEVEGASLTDSIDIGDDYESEVQFALDVSGAGDGHNYEFELYDATRGVSLGTVGATLTIEAGAQTFYQNAGQGTTSPTGVLNKQGYKDTGGHAMVITGTLATATIFLQAVGGYAVTIAGTLSTVITNVRSVGGHAMTITGTLIKKGFKNVGGYSMTITGALSTVVTFIQSAGGALVNIIGSLATSFTEGGGAVKRGAASLMKLL